MPVVQGDSQNRLGVFIDNPASLTTLLTQVKNARQDKLSVTINVHTAFERWRGCVRDCLAEDTMKAIALKIKTLTIA